MVQNFRRPLRLKITIEQRSGHPDFKVCYGRKSRRFGYNSLMSASDLNSVIRQLMRRLCHL